MRSLWCRSTEMITKRLPKIAIKITNETAIIFNTSTNVSDQLLPGGELLSNDWNELSADCLFTAGWSAGSATSSPKPRRSSLPIAALLSAWEEMEVPPPPPPVHWSDWDRLTSKLSEGERCNDEEGGNCKRSWKESCSDWSACINWSADKGDSKGADAADNGERRNESDEEATAEESDNDAADETEESAAASGSTGNCESDDKGNNKEPDDDEEEPNEDEIDDSEGDNDDDDDDEEAEDEWTAWEREDNADVRSYSGGIRRTSRLLRIGCKDASSVEDEEEEDEDDELLLKELLLPLLPPPLLPLLADDCSWPSCRLRLRLTNDRANWAARLPNCVGWLNRRKTFFVLNDGFADWNAAVAEALAGLLLAEEFVVPQRLGLGSKCTADRRMRSWRPLSRSCNSTQSTADMTRVEEITLSFNTLPWDTLLLLSLLFFPILWPPPPPPAKVSTGASGNKGGLSWADESKFGDQPANNAAFCMFSSNRTRKRKKKKIDLSLINF